MRLPMTEPREALAALDPMIALLHEARCGPENTEHQPWTLDHFKWDMATVKALRLLGFRLAAEARSEGLDALREAAQRLVDTPKTVQYVEGTGLWEDIAAIEAALAALSQHKEPNRE